MPDSNDIVYETYGLDIFALIKSLFSETDGSGIYDTLLQIWEVYSVLAFIVSLIFIVGIVYSYIRFNQLAQIEADQLLAAEELWKELYGGAHKNSPWSQIESHIESGSPNDWKLAIIEADIMLDKVLTDAGYAGTSIGDKLKSASPQSFTTVQDAWDAHLIRNKIAHEGSDFVLTQRTAKEAIYKYKRVFQEFKVL